MEKSIRTPILTKGQEVLKSDMIQTLENKENDVAGGRKAVSSQP